MFSKWLKRFNPTTGKKEKFYPITHSTASYHGAESKTTVSDELNRISEQLEETAESLAKKAPIDSPNFTTAVSLGRKADTVVGTNSTALGSNTTASGKYSHAEGGYTTASGKYSHAEGYGTTVSGNYSHAEGAQTTASGDKSHAEGNSSNKATDVITDISSATSSDIITAWTSKKFSLAKGEASHVSGKDCLALGSNSHAEGYCTTASGNYSHAEGYQTTALANQHAQGHYNNTTTATGTNNNTGTSTGTAFVIGNGTSTSASNAFRIAYDGKIYAPNSSIQSGADYAEYFEWADGNPNEEDRVGYFVTFDEDNPEKIRIANEDDYILGIVSGMPSVIGNGDECWKHRYVLDDFGRYIEETFEYETEIITGYTDDGEPIIEKETKTGTKWKENPEYDQTKTYTPRAERAEWSAIGMLGVLPVYDDGTCTEHGYCTVSDGGIATACVRSESINTYIVLKRVTDNIVEVLFK